MRRILLAGTALIFCGVSYAQESDRPEILVTGKAEIAVLPDTFKIMGGLTSRGPSRADVLEELAKRIEDINETIPTLNGLETASVKTSEIAIYSIRPEGCDAEDNLSGYSDEAYPKNCDPIEEYAGVTITIIGSPIQQAGNTLSLASELGFDQLEIDTFIVSDAMRHKNEAESLAIKDAIDRANRLAAASGTRVGEILAISDGNSRLQSWTEYSEEVRERVLVTGSRTTRYPNVTITLEPEPETFSAEVKLRVALEPVD